MDTGPVTVEAEDVEPFVHLHTHTEFSLLDGASRINDLVAAAKGHGQKALAITDHGALYGAVKFYTAARAAGVKPIIGCEMYMAPRSRHDKEGRTDRDPNHLILLARNETGYRNLIQLVSRSHLEGYYYKPRIDKELLAEHAEGLICLSACIGGELPQAILGGDMDAAESVARQHMEIFGRGRLLPRADGPRHPRGGCDPHRHAGDRAAHRAAARGDQRRPLHRRRRRRGARHPPLHPDAGTPRGREALPLRRARTSR